MWFFCPSPSACEYGDRRNCSALTYPGDCYNSLSDGSAARNICCQTCKNFETGILGISNISECFVCSLFQFSLIILLLLFVGCYRLWVWRQGSGLSRYWVLRLRLGRGTAAVLWHLPVLQSAHTRPGFQQHCTAQYDMIKLTKYDIIW